MSDEYDTGPEGMAEHIEESVRIEEIREHLAEAPTTLSHEDAQFLLSVIDERDKALPYEPPGLRDLIASIKYRPGWLLRLGLFREGDEARGWALYVTSETINSYDHSQTDYRVLHEFIVPPASYNRATWTAWVFDRLRAIDDHEAGEFFMVDGVRVFGPHHGNGEDPYRVWYASDAAETRTKFGNDTRDAIAAELEAALAARRNDPEFMARIRASIEENRETLDALAENDH